MFQAIPTLKEVLESVPFECTFQIEVKTDKKTKLLKLCSELVLIFAELNLYDRAWITSSDTKILKRMKLVAPNIRTD